MNQTDFSAVALRRLVCSECGIAYAISERYLQARQEDARDWLCPGGHSQAYVESDNKRLRRNLEKAKERTRWAEERADRLEVEKEHETRVKRGYMGQLARTQKRIRGGVCPFCNRQFKNLQRHMECKHKEGT